MPCLRATVKMRREWSEVRSAGMEGMGREGNGVRWSEVGRERREKEERGRGRGRGEERGARKEEGGGRRKKERRRS